MRRWERDGGEVALRSAEACGKAVRWTEMVLYSVGSTLGWLRAGAVGTCLCGRWERILGDGGRRCWRALTVLSLYG